MKRLFLASLPALFLQGCIPAPYGPYYQPSYPDNSAALIKEYCRGQAGPPSILEFAGPEGIRFSVSAAKKYMLDEQRSDRPLRISINVPAGTHFQFLADSITISDQANSTAMTARPNLEVNAAFETGPNTVLNFDKLAPTSARDATASPEALAGKMLGKMNIYLPEIKNFVPQRVQLQFPSIQLEHGMQAFPDETLQAEKYGTHGYVYQSGEYRKSLEERRDTCLRNTPQRHCEYIVELNSDSLSHRTGNFTLLGRYYVYDLRNHTPFVGTMELAFHTAETWHIADRIIRLKDLDSGKQHEYTISRMPLWFGYTVPLTTAITGVGADNKARTTLYIDTSLGEKMAPHYFVRLPPMRINGRNYTLKPIELELRMLDGGIEPFNC